MLSGLVIRCPTYTTPVGVEFAADFVKHWTHDTPERGIMEWALADPARIPSIHSGPQVMAPRCVEAL